MNVRALVSTVPLVILSACWTGASSPSSHASAAGPAEPAGDPTLAADVDKVGGALARPRGGEMTAVEIVGWTETRALVYRTAICDPDQLGGRGPFCTIEVCESALGASEPACSAVFDETVGALTAPFDRATVIAAVEAEEAKHHATSRGSIADPAGVVLDTDHGDVWAKAPIWFGTTRWRVLTVNPDEETGAMHGYHGVRVTHAHQSPDGGCLAFTIEGLRDARYESVTGVLRFAIATARCR